MSGLSAWISDNLSDSTKADLLYVGRLPAINTREDYKNFPHNLFPFVGVARTDVDYAAGENQGSINPVTVVQFVFSARVPGVLPDEDMAILQERTQELQDMILGAIREDMFGMPEVIQAARLLSLYEFPSFYGKEDSNRKAFSIGYFTVELYTEAI